MRRQERERAAKNSQIRRGADLIFRVVAVDHATVSRLTRALQRS